MTDIEVYTRIQADLLAARKARKTEELKALQMLKSKIQETEKKTGTLTNDSALSAVISYHKSLANTLDLFPDGHPNKALREEEISFIERYLPKKASLDDVKALVQKAVADAKVKRAGPIVGAVMKQLGKSGDGKVVKTLVEEALIE